MKSGHLTIVAYHYVRDVKNSPYPGIKALPVEDFEGQLEYLVRHYSIVSADQVMAAMSDEDGPSLPPRAALLTFDDGYSDHVRTVLPMLAARNLPAVFFPSVRPLVEKCVLDVNKIHFILSAAEAEAVLEALHQCLEEYRGVYDLDSDEVYWREWGKKGRWDPPEVMFIKRMLQRGLPKPARHEIASALFQRFVTSDEAGFAEELYMSKEDLETLKAAGMAIGCHGYAHDWLGTLGTNEQEDAIDRALAFLSDLGIDTERWMMCYPYGNYDHRLLALVASKGCRVGLSVRPGIARQGIDDPLRLPRLDTNDLPKRPDAEPSPWTLQTA